MNNKGTDQLPHPLSLISAYVIPYLENKNINFLASLYSWTGWFEPNLAANLEDRFSRVEAHLFPVNDVNTSSFFKF